MGWSFSLIWNILWNWGLPQRDGLTHINLNPFTLSKYCIPIRGFIWLLNTPELRFYGQFPDSSRSQCFTMCPQALWVIRNLPKLILYPPPHPPKACSYPSLKNTPSSRILDEKKTPLLQPISLILKPNKSKTHFFSLYKIKYPFRESGNNYIKPKTLFIYVRRILHYF